MTIGPMICVILSFLLYCIHTRQVKYYDKLGNEILKGDVVLVLYEILEQNKDNSVTIDYTTKPYKITGFRYDRIVVSGGFSVPSSMLIKAKVKGIKYV